MTTPETPAPLGPLHYDKPRSLKIREPEDLNTVHSVVHSGVSIVVETLTEAHGISDSWQIIMQAAADKAAEILAALRVPAP